MSDVTSAPGAAGGNGWAAGPLAGFEAALVRVNQWLVIGLMGSMAVLVFANVVMRYVFNNSIIWVEELTQYQMIWVTYLGAGLALREGRLVAVDSLQDLLSVAWRRAVRHFLALALAVFLLALAVLGARIAVFTWTQETPVMNIPAGLPYLAVPIGAAGMLLHIVLFWGRFVERGFEHAELPAVEEH